MRRLSRMLEGVPGDIASAYMKGGATPEKREPRLGQTIHLTSEPTHGAPAAEESKLRLMPREAEPQSQKLEGNQCSRARAWEAVRR